MGKEWYYNNKREANERSRILNKQYYHNDNNFRIKTIMRVQLRRLVRGHYETSIVQNYIGCNIDKLRHWLQITANVNGYYDFDINNITKDYHIDHKIPISQFDLTNEEDLKRAYHWSNLQILSAKDNKKKYTFNDLSYNKVRNSLSAKVFNMMYNDNDK